MRTTTNLRESRDTLTKWHTKTELLHNYHTLNKHSKNQRQGKTQTLKTFKTLVMKTLVAFLLLE